MFFPPETWPRGQQKAKIATNINACCDYSNPPGGAVMKPPNSCRPITVFQQFEQEAGLDYSDPRQEKDKATMDTG